MVPRSRIWGTPDPRCAPRTLDAGLFRLAGVQRTPPEPLPPGPTGLDPAAVASSQRTRLIDAMEALCFEVGYSAVTIADLTARARTAKRTFYVHFEDREACFCAAYERVHASILEAILEATAGETDPRERLRLAIEGILAAFAANPAAAHAYLAEVLTVGPGASRARLATLEQFTDLYVGLHQEVQPPGTPAMSRTRALAVVGAIELPMGTLLREDGLEGLPASFAADLADAAYTLVYGS